MDSKLRKKIKEEHIVFITSSLNAEQTSDIIFDILNWSEESPKSKINIYLSSFTFDFTNVITIYDVLKSINNPISVYCIGAIGGYATLFLACATKGRRFILKNTVISLNQPYASLQNGVNQQTEVEIVANEVKKEREIFEKILSEKLEKPIEEIHDNVENDHQFDAKEALEYGLVDYILE